ncbi:hypothetical protein [Lactobacillus intestinalis]|uniref:hypothetical protein n=1 Tax=Lactobacillus intestinalis TaxID=151781 RepID=UPI0025A9B0CF|nr:hypothetical protein [Lactobacillus intestinalis]
MSFDFFKIFSKIRKENKKSDRKITDEQQRIEKEHERLSIEYEKAKTKYESKN